MTLLTNPTLTEGAGRRILAGALVSALVTPFPAVAFFQQTKLEGPVGTDLGGVWLSVHHVMPEFRITFPKPASGPAVPLEVGPIPADLEPVIGKNAKGVSVTKCVDAGFCTDNGLVEGDILLAVNSTEMVDVASFETAVANPPQTVFLSVRRPALKMTTARLLKTQYAAREQEIDGKSVAVETLDIKVLDLALPFADQIEQSRRDHNLFNPSAAELESLGKKWFELEPSKPLLFLNGKHRFVAKSDFDESLATDKSLTDAKYALIMDLGANPVRGGGGQLIDVYGIESVDSGRIEGNYVTVTIAAAPFPINIEFKGRFRMTKIADWSDQDDKARAARDAARKPKEDLSKFETLPDVPAPAKPAEKAD